MPVDYKNLSEIKQNALKKRKKPFLSNEKKQTSRKTLFSNPNKTYTGLTFIQKLCANIHAHKMIYFLNLVTFIG